MRCRDWWSYRRPAASPVTDSFPTRTSSGINPVVSALTAYADCLHDDGCGCPVAREPDDVYCFPPHLLSLIKADLPLMV